MSSRRAEQIRTDERERIATELEQRALWSSIPLAATPGSQDRALVRAETFTEAARIVREGGAA